MLKTYETKYGKITLYSNEIYIGNQFENGNYWDENTLLKLKPFINPERNILEIGGHCGTSSIIYSTFLNNEKKLYVYEPQEKMYELLIKNINQNNLQNKIIPHHSGVFCYNGKGNMNNIDLDGGGGIVADRYKDDRACNFGGIGLGKKGEQITLTTVDNMNLKDIGFIHCDAQGAENFIFSAALNTITRDRPVILYENNEDYDKTLYNSVCRSYPQYKKSSTFNIKKILCRSFKLFKCY